MNLSKCLKGQNYTQAEMTRFSLERGIDQGIYSTHEELCLALAEPEVRTYTASRLARELTRGQLNTYAVRIGVRYENYGNKMRLSEAIVAMIQVMASASSASAPSASAPSASAPSASAPSASASASVPAPSDWRPFPLTLDNDTCGYDLGEVLGAGAYAQVYKLLKDDKEYALKMEIFSADKEPNASALTESYILRQTRHPHLIRCYDAFFECDGTNNGRLRLILERANQGDMSRWLANDHLSDKDKLDALFGILSGLSFLHSKQIIHCDLKPCNILFHQGVAKIADFGLSVRDIGVSKDTNVQTVLWRSPEIFNHDPYFTTKIDMWSVGALIWDLFGDGTLLFVPESGYDPALTTAEIYLVMMEKVANPINLPPSPYKVELEALMRSCFIVDPSDRISANQALQLPLFSTYEIPEGHWINDTKTYPLPNKEIEQWLLDNSIPLGIPIQSVSLAINIFERVPNIIDTKLTASACLLIGDMLLGPEWPVDIDDYAGNLSYSVESLVQEMAQVCNKLQFQLYPDQWVTACIDPEIQAKGIERYINDILSDDEERMWVGRRFDELCMALQ